MSRVIIRVSEESAKFIKQYADSQGVDQGEAADKLLAMGNSRRQALARYAKAQKKEAAPKKASKKAAKKSSAKKGSRAKKAAAPATEAAAESAQE
jgi:spore cortex formation protein SpoVR/YcgB (stage V sporulation)